MLCLLQCLLSWWRLKEAELTGSALAANLASRPSPLSSQPGSLSESDSSSSSEVSASEKRFPAQRQMCSRQEVWTKGQIASYCCRESAPQRGLINKRNNTAIAAARIFNYVSTQVHINTHTRVGGRETTVEREEIHCLNCRSPPLCKAARESNSKKNQP